MRIPTIRGVIDRRILVNYRVDPERLARLLPAPFQPQLVDGHGIAGICLIRLTQVRPRGLPPFLGISSENAAHRIAVQWPVGDGMATGVYIPRRDTSARINVLAGGRIFPGEHHHADFDVRETEKSYRVVMNSRDGGSHVHVEGETADAIPASSLFASTDAVSEFFESGSLGYSPDHHRGQLDGLELRTLNWQVQPLEVSRVESSFFEDENIFPKGSITFDNALLMRDIDHEWHSRESICCADGVNCG